MLDGAVISDAAAAEAALDPIGARLLAEVRDPASAAGVAARIGLPRQKVNYHLRMLEGFGLLELVEERRRGNVTEPNRLSARWMLALAARLVKDVGTLITGADRSKQLLATFAMDGEVTFASAADRAAFVGELAAGTAKLMEKYHSGTAAGGRKHRLVVALHPSVKPDAKDQTAPHEINQTAGRPGQTEEP